MILVQYNDHYEKVFIFSVDQIVTLDSTDTGTTKLELTNGRQEELMIDINDFVATVFSAENMQSEYVVVDIDRPDPEVVEA